MATTDNVKDCPEKDSITCDSSNKTVEVQEVEEGTGLAVHDDVPWPTQPQSGIESTENMSVGQDNVEEIQTAGEITEASKPVVIVNDTEAMECENVHLHTDEFFEGETNPEATSSRYWNVQQETDNSTHGVEQNNLNSENEILEKIEDTLHDEEECFRPEDEEMDFGKQNVKVGNERKTETKRADQKKAFKWLFKSPLNIIIYPLSGHDLTTSIFEKILLLTFQRSSIFLSFGERGRYKKGAVLLRLRHTEKYDQVQTIMKTLTCKGGIKPKLLRGSPGQEGKFEEIVEEISRDFPVGKEETASVFVNDLPKNASQEMLHFLFPSARSVQLPVVMESDTHRSAILEFDSLEEAKFVVWKNQRYRSMIGDNYLRLNVIGHDEKEESDTNPDNNQKNVSRRARKRKAKKDAITSNSNQSPPALVSPLNQKEDVIGEKRKQSPIFSAAKKIKTDEGRTESDQPGTNQNIQKTEPVMPPNQTDNSQSTPQKVTKKNRRQRKKIREALGNGPLMNNGQNVAQMGTPSRTPITNIGPDSSRVPVQRNIAENNPMPQNQTDNNQLTPQQFPQKNKRQKKRMREALGNASLMNSGQNAAPMNTDQMGTPSGKPITNIGPDNNRLPVQRNIAENNPMPPNQNDNNQLTPQPFPKKNKRQRKRMREALVNGPLMNSGQNAALMNRDQRGTPSGKPITNIGPDSNRVPVQRNIAVNNPMPPNQTDNNHLTPQQFPNKNKRQRKRMREALGNGPSMNSGQNVAPMNRDQMGTPSGKLLRNIGPDRNQIPGQRNNAGNNPNTSQKKKKANVKGNISIMSSARRGQQTQQFSNFGSNNSRNSSFGSSQQNTRPLPLLSSNQNRNRRHSRSSFSSLSIKPLMQNIGFSSNMSSSFSSNMSSSFSSNMSSSFSSNLSSNQSLLKPSYFSMPSNSMLNQQLPKQQPFGMSVGSNFAEHPRTHNTVTPGPYSTGTPGHQHTGTPRSLMAGIPRSHKTISPGSYNTGVCGVGSNLTPAPSFNNPYNRGSLEPYVSSSYDTGTQGSSYNTGTQQSSYNDGTKGPYNSGTQGSYNSGTQGPYSSGTQESYNSGGQGSYNRGIQGPYNSGTQGPQNSGTQGPYNSGTQGPYNCGTQGPYNSGTQGSYNSGTQGPSYNSGTQGSNNTGTQGPSYNSGTQGSYDNSGTQGSYDNSGTQGPSYNSGTQGSYYNSGTQGSYYNSGTQDASYNDGTQGSSYNTGTHGSSYNTGPQDTSYNTETHGSSYDSGTQDTFYNTGTQGPPYNTGTQGPSYNTGTQGSSFSAGTQGSSYNTGPVDAKHSSGSTGPYNSDFNQSNNYPSDTFKKPASHSRDKNSSNTSPRPSSFISPNPSLNDALQSVSSGTADPEQLRDLIQQLHQYEKTLTGQAKAKQRNSQQEGSIDKAPTRDESSLVKMRFCTLTNPGEIKTFVNDHLVKSGFCPSEISPVRYVRQDQAPGNDNAVVLQFNNNTQATAAVKLLDGSFDRGTVLSLQMVPDSPHAPPGTSNQGRFSAIPAYHQPAGEDN